MSCGLGERLAVKSLLRSTILEAVILAGNQIGRVGQVCKKMVKAGLMS